MSMRKDEFEHLRVLAPKCDHRNQTPVASFGIAADLRAHKGRGGRMFEKRKQRTDKFIVENTDNHRRDSLLGTNLFAPHPAPWNPDQSFGHLADRGTMDHMNYNDNQSPWTNTSGNQEDEADTEDKRLKKLYRILQYSPPEGLPQLRPVSAPKVDLRSMPQVPSSYGRNFNRNAKGWNAIDNVDSGPQQTANPAPRPMHLSGLSTSSDLSFERQQSVQSDEYSRPRSWHSMQIEDDEILYGDYNPRPKAWQAQYNGHMSPSSPEMVPFGDFNLKPKAWMSEYPSLGGPDDVNYGDYNARPNPWKSQHPTNKGKIKGRIHFRVGNSRPKGWHATRDGRYMLRVISEDVVDDGDDVYGDFNARPKGWRSKEKHNRDKIGYKDFNARPKAWQSSADDDSSSLSSYSSEESFDYDTYYHYGRARFHRRVLPASDV